MSNTLIKAFVVVLFAGGIFAIVYFKSQGSEDPKTEQTEEVVEEAEATQETDTADSPANETNETQEAPEKTDPGRPNVNRPPGPEKNPQPTIEDIIIPSSKSAVGTFTPQIDTRSIFKPDTSKKK
jgi:cytoskeletal protein RodZ